MSGGLLGEGRTPAVVELRAFMDSDVPVSLWELVALGCLVSVGTTRDRGAVSVTVTKDGEYEREYFRRSDDCHEWLGVVRAAISARNGHAEPPVPPEVRKPRRRGLAGA